MEATTYTRTATWASVLEQALAGDAESRHRLRGWIDYMDDQFADGCTRVFGRPESFSSDPDEAVRNRDEECSY